MNTQRSLGHEVVDSANRMRAPDKEQPPLVIASRPGPPASAGSVIARACGLVVTLVAANVLGTGLNNYLYGDGVDAPLDGDDMSPF